MPECVFLKKSKMPDSKSEREFRDIYERYAFKVHARCHNILKSEDEAWDATQEVFMKLMKNLHKLRERDTVLYWLLRVSTNHCISILRKKRGVSFNEEVHHSPSKDPGQDKALILKDIIEKLMKPWDKKTREIVIYAYLDGYQQEEISRITGYGESTIRRHLTRFKAKSLQWRQQNQEVFYAL